MKDEINIIHCPTESIVADYFTKPIQGSLFEKLRDVIMGYTHPSSLHISSSSPGEDHIEISAKLCTSSEFKPNGKISSTTVKNGPSVRQILHRKTTSKISD